MYDMAAAVARLEAGIEALSAQGKSFDRRLFGNGQPGELHRIEARIEEMGTRVTGLEKFKWTISGAGLVFGAIGGLVVGIVERIIRGLIK